jgi:ribosomal protein S18 acetylase RimI-like enzyme
LAIDSNNVVGVVVAKIFQDGGESELTTSCPKIGFISDLIVAKKNRGKGIGKLLIKRAEEYFYNNNCDYTQLEVFAPNKTAFELYKKLGFEVNCYYLSKRTDIL